MYFYGISALVFTNIQLEIGIHGKHFHPLLGLWYQIGDGHYSAE